MPSNSRYRRRYREINNQIVKTAVAAILALTILFTADKVCAAMAPQLKYYNATDTWVLEVPKVTYLGNYYITGYNPMDGSQCGKSQDSPYLGIGAAGVKVIPGKHVAMYGLDFGTKVYIKGLGLFTVQDRGVGPGKVDVACETNALCFQITGRYQIYIIE